MITVFKKIAKGIQTSSLQKADRHVWIYAENPTERELERLTDLYGLELGHLHDALDPNEVPRLEKEGSSFYVFTRVPKESIQGSWVTTPVLLIFVKDTLIVVAKDQEELFEKFIQNRISTIPIKPITVFTALFNDFIMIYHNTIMKLNKKIGTINNKTDEIQNSDIIELVFYENVLNELLNAAIQTNVILKSLSSIKGLFTTDDENDLVEDIFLANGQLIQISKSILTKAKNMRDAYSTILTNNLNRVIRFLTVLTVILTIPMIITSMYGMNVRLPHAESEFIFLTILVATGVICTTLIIIFRKKNWL